MQVFPRVISKRFSQLERGDLFILLENDERYVALKCFDPADGGDELILLLGPNLPDDLGPPPRLIGEQMMTVMSFGQDYVLRLPTSPEGWMADTPPPATPTILLADDKPYFRANAGHRPGQFRATWVEISSGLASRSAPAGIKAFAVKWELLIREPGVVEHVILRCG